MRQYAKASSMLSWTLCESRHEDVQLADAKVLSYNISRMLILYSVSTTIAAAVKHFVHDTLHVVTKHSACDKAPCLSS